MVDWIPVDSTRISAVAYDTASETIYVRFRDGSEYYYSGCPSVVWEQFTSPGTSKGKYVHDELDHHPHGRVTG